MVTIFSYLLICIIEYLKSITRHLYILGVEHFKSYNFFNLQRASTFHVLHVKTMDTRYILLFLCTLCVLSSGVKSWLFSNTHNDVDAVRDDLSQAADSVRPSSTFEINTADDKFLLEASIARELSALDACHHRVVSELEGRCGDLTEEELAKLSVRLFNCQAAVEERQTYSCTSDMAIADCTRDMDSTTWNAYQVLSLLLRQ